ncbi:MAG: glycerate kinase [Proteobacteria bacterium]|nr:glycerate kinase [Pseudomonadota bacterium]
MEDGINKKLAIDIFNSALHAADPYESVRIHTDYIVSTYHNEKFNKLFLVSFGKAAFPMTRAVIDSAGDIITSGIVITKYGHATKTDLSNKINIFEAGHPVPDENGFRVTKNIINLLKKADRQTLVVSLISGGGSALLVAPCNGITLSEKQRVTELLLKAGANINELNTIRKHISGVKGGRLAELAFPAKTLSLILSDVIGDRLDVISSGPTSPDKTTYQDALGVISKYNLTDRVPQKILSLLKDGVQGNLPETPKEGNPIFEKVENIIVGSNRMATDAARIKASELGFDASVISTEIQGEAKEVGSLFAKKAIEIRRSNVRKPICLIAGGETTVTVKGNGTGGRNMEMALSFALEIDGIDGITFLSAGSDGTDGPTDAAGAFVDGQTVKSAKVKGLDPEVYLKNNDSYNLFDKINGLFITGPTGTNVMDIQIILIA